MRALIFVLALVPSPLRLGMSQIPGHRPVRGPGPPGGREWPAARGGGGRGGGVGRADPLWGVSLSGFRPILIALAVATRALAGHGGKPKGRGRRDQGEEKNGGWHVTSLLAS